MCLLWPPKVPSWDTFYTDFVRKNRPVVFRGAARSQRGFEKWTDEYLRKTWGSRKIHVELNKSESRGGQTLEMPFRKFLEENSGLGPALARSCMRARTSRPMLALVRCVVLEHRLWSMSGILALADCADSPCRGASPDGVRCVRCVCVCACSCMASNIAVPRLRLKHSSWLKQRGCRSLAAGLPAAWASKPRVSPQTAYVPEPHGGS